VTNRCREASVVSRTFHRPAHRRIFAIVATIAPLTLSPAGARADETLAGSYELPPLVVSPTRLPTPENEVASSLTVITGRQIEQKQQRTLPDALQEAPGLNIVQTGGPGGTTSVFMRGTNADHTKVFIDGIDVSDPGSPGGNFDFAHMLTGGIDRVEVLRGPQSGLYGSDAIGGVIDIITKSGNGPPHLVGSIEGGSFGTFNQTGLASGSFGRFHYAFDIEHFHSADTPVTPKDLLPPGQKLVGDDYDNKTIGAKIGIDLTDNLDVGIVARHIDTFLAFTGDDFSVFPSVPAASESYSKTEQLFVRGTIHQTLLDGLFDHTLGIAYTDHRDHDISPGFAPTDVQSNRIKIDWQGNIHLVPGETLTLGAEHQTDNLDDNPTLAEVSNDAGFIQLQSKFGERFFNTASLRYDSNETFGGKMTYRVAPAVLIPETGTKLKGSVGTGFKAPTLKQLFVSFPDFNFFANPDLKSETSLGWDAGFEQKLPGVLPGAPVEFGATYFHNDIKNLITDNATFTTLINVGQATTYGVESFVAWKPVAALGIRGDYTYTMANDDILHEELARRPKNKASLSATWQATDLLSLTAGAVYVGPWIDVSRAGTVSGLRANGYTVVNIAGTYDLGDGLQAFMRVNNLLNRHYQDPTGFERPGVGVFGGLKLAYDMPAAAPAAQ
jgi:vitamin B12 transporter